MLSSLGGLWGQCLSLGERLLLGSLLHPDVARMELVSRVGYLPFGVSSEKFSAICGADAGRVSVQT